MKYNEKVERFAPKLGRKNLVNGLSCPPFVYMDNSDDGMWVHYVTYCENITRQKYKRCLVNANYWVAISYHCIDDKRRQRAERHHRKWLELANKFNEARR